MKRYIVLLALCVMPFMAYAQDEGSKQYLPEEGDFAIGVDIAPLFKFVGNLFNNSTDNTLESLSGNPVTPEVDGFKVDDIAPDVSIMGKYMLTDEWGVRANIGVMVRSNTTRAYVVDDADLALNPLSEAKLVDKRNQQRHGFSALLGAEYHKGKRRVQGIFGAGVIVGLYKDQTNYTYANALTTINHQPTTAWTDATNKNGYRALKTKSATNAFFGIMGSVGVEWFVAPKIALGAEVDLALYYVQGAQEYTYSEGYNTVLDKIENRYDITNPGNQALIFGTDNLGASLYMSFYF